VLALPANSQVARFDALAAGFAAVLHFPFEKRQLFNALHSVTAGEDGRDGVIRLQDYARASAGARNLSILVADDNPTNREVLGKIVERGGHAVTLVEDGDQALDAVEHGRFDVVILDRNMPGTGGIEALRAIRLMARGEERIPVIVLSADATPDAQREALDAGADTFLAKPVEALRLLEQISAIAGRRPARKPVERPLGARAAPGRAPAAGSAVVNLDTLAQLQELGSSPAFLQNLAGVFVADGASLVERMEKALVSRSYQELRAHLHALKGSSASIGADRLTRMCASLGKNDDAQLRLQGARMLRSLTEELGAVRSELERYMRERQQSAS
jgi:two-component system sensor histidine kinase RpfC